MLNLGIIIALAVLITLAIRTGKVGEMRLAIVDDLAVLPAGAFGMIVTMEGFRRRRV